MPGNLFTQYRHVTYLAALRTDGQELMKQKSREERWFVPGHIEAGGKWVPPQMLLLIRTALGYAPVVVAGGCFSGGGGRGF